MHALATAGHQQATADYPQLAMHMFTLQGNHSLYISLTACSVRLAVALHTCADCRALQGRRCPQDLDAASIIPLDVLVGDLHDHDVCCRNVRNTA